MQISCAVTAQLIIAFVFATLDSTISHDKAQINFQFEEISVIVPLLIYFCCHRYYHVMSLLSFHSQHNFFPKICNTDDAFDSQLKSCV